MTLQRFWELSSSPKTIVHINQYMQKQNKHTNQSMESLQQTAYVQNRLYTMQATFLMLGAPTKQRYIRVSTTSAQYAISGLPRPYSIFQEPVITPQQNNQWRN